MAKDSDGDYYYEAGTVNELFDDIALVEDDGGLEVETPDGVSRVSGVETLLGGVRDSTMDSDDLAEGETAIYTRVTSGTDTDGLSLFAAHYDGSSAYEVELAEFVASSDTA